NAKDRTVASAYSIRPLPDARVSMPLSWDEVPGCDPAAFTIDTVPARFASVGDPWAGMDEAVGSLDALLELADRDEAAGLPGGAGAAALRQAGGRGPAGPAVQAPGFREHEHAEPDRAPPVNQAADRGGPRADQGGGHGGARALEGPACRRMAAAGVG